MWTDGNSSLSILLLTSAACVYWILSLLVLLLRVCEGHFRNVTRYSRRSTAVPYAHTKPKKPLDSRCLRSLFTPLGQTMHAAAVLLERSPLCRIHLSRKWGFGVFYVTGLFTGAALLRLGHARPGATQVFSFLPLIAFLLHCAVRLGECLWVHRFRGGAEDRVTLFAVIAGASFYVFAAISSGGAGLTMWHVEHEWKSCAGTGLLFLLHLLLQVVQARHHAILASLRNEKDGNHPMKNNTEEDYHFPSTYLFVCVLEPHYACEVLMYVVNTASVWGMLLFASNQQAEVGVNGRAELWGVVVGAGCALASLGVTVFTFINLAITAAEHRRFWENLNKKRYDNQKRELIPKWDLFFGIW